MKETFVFVLDCESFDFEFVSFVVVLQQKTQIQVDVFFSLLCVCRRVFWRMRLLRERRESTSWPFECVDCFC